MKTINLKISKINKKFLENRVFVYPTETVYGIGCDPFDKELVQRIYQIKKREADKPLLLIADDIKTVDKYFKLSRKEKELMQEYWPGALTILLKPKKKQQFRHLNCQDRVGVRVSGNKVARDIAKMFGGLVVSTSANMSGEPETRSRTAIWKQFCGRELKPDLILDVGKLSKENPSTIVLVEKDEVKVLRKGGLVIMNNE